MEGEHLSYQGELDGEFRAEDQLGLDAFMELDFNDPPTSPSGTSSGGEGVVGLCI